MKLISNTSTDKSLVWRIIGDWVALRIVLYTTISANQVTVFRLVLAVFVCGLIISHFYITAGLLFIVCYILDFADGAVARMRNKTTELGKWLEDALERVLEKEYGLVGLSIAISINTKLIWIIFALICFGQLSSVWIRKCEKV